MNNNLINSVQSSDDSAMLTVPVKNTQKVKTVIDSKRMSSFRFIVTNARSLRPKIKSLCHAFNELDLHIAVVSESWLRPGPDLGAQLLDVEDRENICLLHKSRQSRRGRTAGGGIVIGYNKNKINTERRMRRKNFELISAVGRLPGTRQRIAVHGIYIPPQTRAGLVDEINELVKDEISKIEEFPDISETGAGATRRGAALDLTYTNFLDSMNLVQVCEHLKNDDGHPSDHDIVYVESNLKNKDRFKWIKYRTRIRNKGGDAVFSKKLREMDWSHVTREPNNNKKAELLVSTLNHLMNESYPMVTRKKKSTDDPWITPFIKSKIKTRKKCYRWVHLKKNTDRLIREGKKSYYEKFTELAKKTGDSALYYKVVGRLINSEAPKPFLISFLVMKTPYRPRKRLTFSHRYPTISLRSPRLTSH